MVAAACATRTKEEVKAADQVFFPIGRQGRGGERLAPNWVPARLVCQACPVRQECLDYALDENIGYGMWGGLTPEERVQLKAKP